LWLSLNLNQVYEIEKSVPIKISVNTPYSATGNIPLNLDVKFRGVGWNLIRLFTSLNLEFNYEVNAKKKESFIILTKDYLNNNLGLSQNLSIISVYPETLYVRIEDYEEKYVSIKPRLTVNCMEGYQVVGRPDVEPDSIKIGGAVDLLKNLHYLSTKEMVFNNVNTNIVTSVRLSDSLSNLLKLSLSEVKLSVNIELTAEKEFTNIEIKIPNVPPDKDVLLIPQSISVQLKGGVNQLAAVDNSMIKAGIDYNKILADTSGFVVPYFELPEGCTVISFKPETIQYVIKKKS
jgi:YbbR domain-containing protein